MTFRARRVLSSTAALAIGLAGCSLIVPGELPRFHCTGSDPSACPSGLVCDTATLVCVTPSSLTDASDGDVLPDDEAGTDAKSEDASPPGPAAIGGSCVVDRDCASGLLCGSSTILTTAIVPVNTKSVCTKPCCRSSDCGSGFVCFPGGTGGSYCVDAKKADRTPPATGGKTGGQACSGPSDCRSGLCSDGRCVDTCCGPDQCASGTTCRIATVATHVAWMCAPPNASASLDIGDPCTANADCLNDNCVQPFSAGKRCTPTCCSANDCAALGLADNVCAYGQAGNDHLKWCFEPNASGKAVGSACSANADCASRYCDAELGKCANVCCTSADCNTGESCLPTPGGTPFLRCVRGG